MHAILHCYNEGEEEAKEWGGVENITEEQEEESKETPTEGEKGGRTGGMGIHFNFNFPF